MSVTDLINQTLVWTPDKPLYDPITTGDPIAFWVGIVMITGALLATYFLIRG